MFIDLLKSAGIGSDLCFGMDQVHGRQVFSKAWREWPKLYPIISLYALLYLFRCALNLVDIPKVRLIEHAACQSYYHSHPLAEGGAEYSVPERECKVVPIQAEVALITGWRMSLDAIPSILTVTFYGTLADQLGRKPALFLVCLGELLALIWRF